MPQSVFEEFGRATKTFRACVQLASTGYGQAAQILGGVVAESCLIMLWAAELGETIDRRAELHAKYGLQLEFEARRDVGLRNIELSEPFISTDDRVEAQRVFGGSANGLWTGHASVYEVIDELIRAEHDEFKRLQIGRLKTALASFRNMTTSTGYAQWSHRSLRTIDADRQALVSNFGEDMHGVSDALLITSTVYSSALDALIRDFAPDLVPQAEAAEAFRWRAWRDLVELARLKDDDPCPCEKPGARWGECHKSTEQLGTVRYEPFTDADLVNRTPFDPKQPRRSFDWEKSFPPPHDVPLGPSVQTFTFELPFTLGLESEVNHTMALFDSWANPDDVGHFGHTAVVRIRLHNEPTDGHEFWPASAAAVLNGFYGKLTDSIGELTVVPFENTYEQWVSLETPSARLKSEHVDDPAYAFHRALDALNTFLTSMELAISDLRVSRISTQEIGPVVFRGLITQDGKWIRLGDLLMHPDSYPYPMPIVPFKSIQRQFEDVFGDLSGGRPFMLANLWHGRALRALRVRGDMAGAVVNLQTAVENMMYDLLRALMVDEGATSTEISAAVGSGLSFKSLVMGRLVPRLGGNWNPNSNGVFGSYWSQLYLLRNRVVHAGYSPSGSEAEGALHAFFAVREFVSERLWHNSKTYPRALLAKVGSNGLVRRGWMTASMRAQCAKFMSEPYPFYWPRDIAKRR